MPVSPVTAHNATRAVTEQLSETVQHYEQQMNLAKKAMEQNQARIKELEKENEHLREEAKAKSHAVSDHQD